MIEEYYLKKFRKNVWILDENLNNSFIAGNKVRKLSYILKDFNSEGILTIGSKFSNHCVATAYYSAKLNVPLKLLILTDEKLDEGLYPNLVLSKKLGAEIIQIQIKDAYQIIEGYKEKYQKYFWIPGGGHTKEGVTAYEQLFIKLIDEHEELRNIEWVLLPYGTGTTAIGILSAINNLNLNIKVNGVSVSRTKENCLKATKDVFDGELKNLEIIDEFAGLYGMKRDGQARIRLKFLQETGVLIDPIYNIRSMEYFYKNQLSNGLIINTGGGGNNFLV